MTSESLSSEVEYLKDYVERIFGHPLSEEAFKTQLNEMIQQKIHDYIYQRYRDWTAPQLVALMNQWNKPLPGLSELGHKTSSGQSQSKQELVETIDIKAKRGRKPKP
jgi:hypothetical protein